MNGAKVALKVASPCRRSSQASAAACVYMAHPNQMQRLRILDEFTDEMLNHCTMLQDIWCKWCA
jgi:hypothetical protein